MFERKRESPTLDVRLLPYLEAKDEAEAEKELGLLFFRYLSYMISTYVEEWTGVYLRAEETPTTRAGEIAAEVRGDVRASLIDKLRKMRARTLEQIMSLDSFVRQTVRNRFIEYLGEKSPHRKMIRGRVYEYISRERNADGSVVSWEVGGNEVYGLAEHLGRAVVINDRYNLLTRHPTEFKSIFSAEELSRWRLSDGGNAVKGELIVEIFKAILKAVGGPVEARHMEEAVVQMTGGDLLGTVTAAPLREEEGPEEWWEGEAPHFAPQQLEDAAAAETFRDLWASIRAMHVTRRRGLILKMDAEGVFLFIAYGIPQQEIAYALEMSLDEFREIRGRLPLTHEEIEERFPGHARSIENAASKAKKFLRKKFPNLFAKRKKDEDERGE